MRIILSPAKKMNINTDDLSPVGEPVFLAKTEEILRWMQSLSESELQILWKCNDKILQQNIERLKDMKLHGALTPAVLSYEGLAFQYMAPIVMEDKHLSYLQKNLRILSGFYGVLKAMDGITPYRLEMQAKTAVNETANLYDFWGDSIYREVRDESGIFINLASKEYSKCIEKYVRGEDRFITITFCEEAKGKLVTKGTYAKMARGEMVRFMAERQITDVEQIRQFDRLGYVYRADLSDKSKLVFERSVK